jgi:hypothetical protein
MHGDITRSNYRNRGAPAGFCKVHAVQYNPPVKYAVKSWSVPLTAGALISMSAVFQFIRFWPKTRTQKCKKHVLHAHGYRERRSVQCRHCLLHARSHGIILLSPDLPFPGSCKGCRRTAKEVSTISSRTVLTKWFTGCIQIVALQASSRLLDQSAK